MPAESAPKTCPWLKWWLAGALVLLFVSFAMTSADNPFPNLSEDDTPIPVSGLYCFGVAIALARTGYMPGILFLLPTLWIPLSFLFVRGRTIGTRVALTLSVSCLFIEVYAAAWVRRVAHFDLDWGCAVWIAATLTQVIGFLAYLDTGILGRWFTRTPATGAANDLRSPAENCT